MAIARRQMAADAGQPDAGAIRWRSPQITMILDRIDPKIINVIDSNKLEHNVVRKPLRTFRHHALARPDEFLVYAVTVPPVSGLNIAPLRYFPAAGRGRPLYSWRRFLPS